MVTANLAAKVSLNSAAFASGARSVEARASKMSRLVTSRMATMGRAVGRMTKMVAGMALKFAAVAIPAAAIAGTYKLARGLKAAADLGGRMSDVAARTKAAVGQLVIMEQAFTDNGIAGEKVADTINKQQKSIAELGFKLSTQVRAFQDLNLTHAELIKLDPAEQFKAIGAAIAATTDKTKRSNAALSIYGKAGAKLLTLFEDKGAMGKAADTIGTQAEILERNAQLFDRISDLMGSAGKKLQGFYVGVLDKVAGRLSESFEKWNAVDFAGIGQQFGEKLGPVLDKVMAFGSNLKKSIEEGGGVEFLTDGLLDAAGKFGVAMSGVISRVGDTLEKKTDKALGPFAGIKAFSAFGAARRLAKPFGRAVGDLTPGQVKDLPGITDEEVDAVTRGKRLRASAERLKRPLPSMMSQSELMARDAGKAGSLKGFTGVAGGMEGPGRQGPGGIMGLIMRAAKGSQGVSAPEGDPFASKSGGGGFSPFRIIGKVAAMAQRFGGNRQRQIELGQQRSPIGTGGSLQTGSLRTGGLGAVRAVGQRKEAQREKTNEENIKAQTDYLAEIAGWLQGVKV